MIFDDNVLFGKKSCDVIQQYFVHIYYHVLKKGSSWFNKLYCQALVPLGCLHNYMVHHPNQSPHIITPQPYK